MHKQEAFELVRIHFNQERNHFSQARTTSHNTEEDMIKADIRTITINTKVMGTHNTEVSKVDTSNSPRERTMRTTTVKAAIILKIVSIIGSVHSYIRYEIISSLSASLYVVV